MLPTDREVLLARMCLLLADGLAAEDRDQNFLEIYNELKAIADRSLNHGD